MNDDDELIVASQLEQQVPSDKPELGIPPKYLESSQAEEQKVEEKQEDEEEEHEYGVEALNRAKKKSKKKVEAPTREIRPQKAVVAKQPKQKFVFQVVYD
jgi:hypothetical protein